MAIIKMTPAQYGALVAKKKAAGYTTKQAVQYRIHEGLPLIGVESIENICGNNYLNVNTLAVKAKNSSKKVA